MSPPPLPASLSSRLQSSIDPTTGACRHHPQVQLCELVQNNTRWVVRRKICYKCGNRNGKGTMHRPGVAVKTADKARENKGSNSERRRSSSVSRRASVSDPTTRPRSMSREPSSRSRLATSAREGESGERVPSRARLAASVPANALVMATPPPAPAPVVVEPEEDEDDDFEESDPIIYIPALSPNEELPPPPPRTDEEAERHAERLEMRRVHDERKKRSGHNNHHVHAPAEPRKEKAEPKGEKGVEPVAAIIPKTEEHKMPSAQAMALLESHGKDPKKKSAHKHKKKKGDDEDEASETSSISTASAKLYQLDPDEFRASKMCLDANNHEPPKEIIPNRSRSRSRPQKKSVDPEETHDITVYEDPPEVKRRPRSRRTTTADAKRTKSEDRRRKTVTDERRHSRSVVDEPTKERSSRRPTVQQSEIKVLSASTARMARQKEGSKSVSHRRRSEKRESSPPRTSGRSVARSTARSTARSAGRSKRSASRSHRRDDGTECHSKANTSKVRSKSASGTRTTCTQPLSVSSDEIGKPTTVTGKVEEKKKRRPSTSKSMPVHHIDLSGDEKSHASSISSSSTIEESFAYSDDEEEVVGDKSRKSGMQSAAPRATAMLKGGAALASKGRSTLIGLRGTSKKWQSALFM